MPLMEVPHGAMEPKGRFIIYGVKAEGDDHVMVEIHTDDFDHAVEQRMVMSCADYKARIFDCKHGRFVPQNVIEFAERQLNKEK